MKNRKLRVGKKRGMDMEGLPKGQLHKIKGGEEVKRLKSRPRVT